MDVPRYAVGKRVIELHEQAYLKDVHRRRGDRSDTAISAHEACVVMLTERIDEMRDHLDQARLSTGSRVPDPSRWDHGWACEVRVFRSVTALGVCVLRCQVKGFEKQRQQLILRQVWQHLQLEGRQSDLVVKTRSGKKRRGVVQSLPVASGRS